MENSTLTVRVQPGARKNELVGLKDGLWQVKIAAPPVKGMANRELVRFLSDALEISRGHIAIKTGLTGRIKTVSVSGLSAARMAERLERHTRQRQPGG